MHLPGFFFIELYQRGDFVYRLLFFYTSVCVWGECMSVNSELLIE